MVNHIGQNFILMIPVSTLPHLPLSGPMYEAQIIFTVYISSNHCVRLRAASAYMFAPARASYFGHACPHYASFMMQLHRAIETAPEQAGTGRNRPEQAGNSGNESRKCMQNNAPNACIVLPKLIIGNTRIHLLLERDLNR